MTTLERLIEQPVGARLVDLATPLASKSEDEAGWQRDRATDCVSASEVHRLLQNWLGARRPLLQDKLYGSTFGGSAATRRGSANESFWLQVAAIERGTAMVANDRVWASLTNPGHRATPDGFEHDGDTLRGVEVKDHHDDWVAPSGGIVTPEHYTQMQWGMHVFGLDEWVYVVGFSDADGNPSTRRQHEIEVVPRDDAHILQSVDVVDRFLAWWADGAPEEEISEALLALHRSVVAAKAIVDAADKKLKANRAAFEKQLEIEYPGATKVGWSHTDPETDDKVTVSKGAVTPTVDEVAWRESEPAKYAAYVRGTKALAAALADAKKTYPATKVAAHGLRVYPAKKAKA
jgi:hypothetical protein